MQTLTIGWLLFVYSTVLRNHSELKNVQTERDNLPTLWRTPYKIIPNWWQRLWLGRLSAYVCASCKYRFNR